jgi:hypothetical protein
VELVVARQQESRRMPVCADFVEKVLVIGGSL